MGGAIGGLLGNKGLGADIGSQLAKITGVGDYQISGLVGGQVPSTFGSRAKSLVVRHVEYIANIVSDATGAFKLQAFDLNPGLNSSFPWLSQIAQGFEEYEWRSMIWAFKSTSGDALNSTNTALGSVLMATEYDSSRPVFQNQQQMANHEFSTTSRQSCSMLHAVECKKSISVLRGHRYVRTGAVPQDDDERFYDHGKFQIASVGNQPVTGGAVIGELWVSYEVEFFKPQLLSGLGYELLTDHWLCGFTGSLPSAADLFGSAYVPNSNPNSPCGMCIGSNLGCDFSTANVIAFPKNLSQGFFNIIISWRMTSGTPATVTIPTTTFTNCVLGKCWNQYQDSQSNDTGATDDTLIMIMMVQVNAQGAYITFGNAGVLPPNPTVDVYINQINYGAVTTNPTNIPPPKP